jgi:hypothetical protein
MDVTRQEGDTDASPLGIALKFFDKVIALLLEQRFEPKDDVKCKKKTLWCLDVQWSFFDKQLARNACKKRMKCGPNRPTILDRR